jgi:uncharacterized Rmd1/YagE family protein
MRHTEFKALVIGDELNLNRIAQHFGYEKKLKWEEALLLKDKALQGIIRQTEDKTVYIYHFGSIVYLNFQHHEIMDVIKYLKNIEPGIYDNNAYRYVDDYMLETDENSELAISNDGMVVDEVTYHSEIVATILAKSVALEKIETEVDRLMDEIEFVIQNLNQGKLAVSDERLAKLSASILGFKLNTISYIMVLDKPDITWINEDAASLFSELSKLFELNDRYGKMRHKIEALMDITEVFSGLVHSKRGTRLEWAVIILIMIEIVLSLVDLFFKRG